MGTATVQKVGECCYSTTQLAKPTKEEILMQFGRPLDLAGLTAALCIEEVGAWHLYNPATHLPPPREVVLGVYGEIVSHSRRNDVPEDPRLLRLLVDAAAFLHGEKTRAIGWQIIGIHPTSGRSILNSVDGLKIGWHFWLAAMNFGLGHMRHDSPDDYFLK